MRSKGSKYNGKGNDPAIYESKRYKNTTTIKVDCKHRLVSWKVDDGWELEVFENNYTQARDAKRAKISCRGG
jgi:hypothetical protein